MDTLVILALRASYRTCKNACSGIEEMFKSSLQIPFPSLLGNEVSVGPLAMSVCLQNMAGARLTVFIDGVSFLFNLEQPILNADFMKRINMCLLGWGLGPVCKLPKI